jgi:hypothetical protein
LVHQHVVDRLQRDLSAADVRAGAARVVRVDARDEVVEHGLLGAVGDDAHLQRQRIERLRAGRAALVGLSSPDRSRRH